MWFLFALFLPNAIAQGEGQTDAFGADRQNASAAQGPCAHFIRCEWEMMQVHRRCTERSRSAIAERCALGAEFEMLTQLGDRRFVEFSLCVVGSEGGNETAQDQQCAGVGASAAEGSHQSGCWRSLAGLRERCLRFQQCCPTAAACQRSLVESDATRALRQHHLRINRKTLSCRAATNATTTPRTENVQREDEELVFAPDADPSILLAAPARAHAAKAKEKSSKGLALRLSDFDALLGEMMRLEEARSRRVQSKMRAQIREELRANQPLAVLTCSQFSADARQMAAEDEAPVQQQVGDWDSPIPISQGIFAAHPIPGSLRRVLAHKQTLAFALPEDPNLQQKRPWHNGSAATKRRSEGTTRLRAYGVRTEKTVQRKPVWPTTGRHQTPAFGIGDPAKAPRFMAKEQHQIDKHIAEGAFTTRAPGQMSSNSSPKQVFPVLRNWHPWSSTSRQHLSTAPAPKEFGRAETGEILSTVSESPTLPTSTQLAALSPIPETTPMSVGNRQRLLRRPKKEFRTAILRMLAQRQPQGFALPSRLDLHRMRLFAARPHLSRLLESANRRRTYFKALMQQTDAFGRKKARAKAAKTYRVPPAEDRAGLAQIDAELSGTTQSTSPTEPTPETATTTALPTSVFFQQQSTPQWGSLFPQIWTRPPPKEATVPLELQLSTPETSTLAARKSTGATGPKAKSAKGTQMPARSLQMTASNGSPKATQTAHTKESDGPSTTARVFPQKNKASGRTRLHGARTHIGEVGVSRGAQNAAQIRRKEKRVKIAWRAGAAEPGYRARVLQVAERAKQATSVSIRRSPSAISDANGELKLVKGILQSQLEKFIRKDGENKEDLRPISHRSLHNHCHLYAACTAEIRKLQSSQCRPAVADGRLVPGPPRRRFGRCNVRLLSLFERVDTARAELELGVEECLAEAITNGTAAALSSCPTDWPVLPPLDPQMECLQRMAQIQQHCRKLGRCCEALGSCQSRADASGLARRVHLEEERLARRSAQCQVQAHEMFRSFRERRKDALKQRRRMRMKARRKMRKMM